MCQDDLRLPIGSTLNVTDGVNSAKLPPYRKMYVQVPTSPHSVTECEVPPPLPPKFWWNDPVQHTQRYDNALVIDILAVGPPPRSLALSVHSVRAIKMFKKAHFVGPKYRRGQSKSRHSFWHHLSGATLNTLNADLMPPFIKRRELRATLISDDATVQRALCRAQRVRPGPGPSVRYVTCCNVRRSGFRGSCQCMQIRLSEFLRNTSGEGTVRRDAHPSLLWDSSDTGLYSTLI